MTDPTLAQRVARLEDIEATTDLTARYATAVNKGWDGKTLDLEAIPSIFGNDSRGAYLSADMTYTRHRPGLAHPQRRHPSRHAPLRNVRGRRCHADVMRH
jgi:hypothetical protein